MSSLGRVCALALTILVGGVGCIASPQPDPPNLVPERVNVRVDRGGSYQLVGNPGSIHAGPGATVSLAALDRPSTPIRVAPVMPDGSFEIPAVTVIEGDELRLWVRDGELRSPAVELAVAAGAVLVPAPTLLRCLTIEPAEVLELDVASGTEVTGDVRLTNACGAPVAIESAALRAPAAGLSIGAVPSTVTTDATVQVRFAPTAPGTDVEEVLLITVSGSERDRRSVTLHGRN